MIEHTRKQYLDRECTHREYYGQFVTKGVSDALGGLDILKSNDVHFNDIPLKRWDMRAPFIKLHVGRQLRDAGDYFTLSGAVCILKEAARQIVEDEEADADENCDPYYSGSM